MKILGEKSLSSKVECTLEILFLIITLVDIAALGVCGITIMSESARYSFFEQYLFQFISVIIVLVVFLTTGIVALYIIGKFIKIFNNLKNNKLFEDENAKCLNKIFIASIVIGILYFIILIGINMFSKNFLSWMGMGEKLLLNLLILVFATGFVVFGTGIKILNEIYIKAIQYKEENDLTI